MTLLQSHDDSTINIILVLLADRTATQYDQHWHHPVVRLSVTLFIVALRVGVQG